MRASCREQLGQFEGALADYAQAAQLGFSDKGLCWAQAALCAYQLGQSEDVLSYGEQAAQAGSDQASWDLVYEAMGVSALQLTQYDASVSYFNKALEANAALVDAYYYRGVAYMALQQYDAAAQDFGASIERGERMTDCYFNRALCELQIGQNDAAQADLETVLTLSDDATLVAAAQAILNEI
jgi:tetratricopeptide (TPR) repeat protein